MTNATIIIVALLGSLATAFVLAVMLRRYVSRIPNWMLVVAVVMAGAGLVVLVQAWRQLDLAEHHKAWPVVDATVIESHVIGERAFRPSIVYEYFWDGQLLRDSSDLNMPGFGGRSNKRNTAENMAREYPLGAAIKVHVNPDNPKQALLRAGPTWDAYGKIGLGGLLIGLAGLVSGLRLTAGGRTREIRS